MIVSLKYMPFGILNNLPNIIQHAAFAAI